jgi:serine/threonine-protein kinase
MTQTGLSLGTPQYMAPEQATGERSVDFRADIYALGAVTYEMLAGQAPFTGPTAQSIVAKLLTEEPASLASLRKSVPSAVDDAIQRALEKLPADRFSSAREFGAALAATDAQSTRPRAPAKVSRAPLAVASIVAAAGCVVGAWGWLRHRPESVAPPSRLAIVVPSGAAFTGPWRLIDISADGQRVVHYSSTGSTTVIEVRDLASTESTPLKSTEGASDLHLSPDGRTIYFADPTRTKMYRMSIAGGTPEPMPGVPPADFLTFGEDGSIWLSNSSLFPYLVGPDGVPHRRFTGDTIHQRFAMLQSLPGGREMLVKEFTSNFGLLDVFDLKTGKLTNLLDFPVAEARYAAGHLVYVTTDGRLNAMPYDIARHKPTGGSVQIADGVSLSGTGFAQFAVAANGTIAYIREQPSGLSIVDRSGAARPAFPEARKFHQPRLSPDGKSILVDLAAADGRDVWLIDRASGTMTRVTSDHDAHDAAWAPDGKSIIYASVKQGVFTVLRTRPGSGSTEVILGHKSLGPWTGRWFPDGKRILAVGMDLQPNSAMDVVMIDSARHLVPLVVTPGADAWPDVSPDGRWLAYASNQSGQFEVYVRPVAGGDQVQVSVDGGSEPMWSHSGRELFYRSFKGTQRWLTSAVIRTAPSLSVISRTDLFSVDGYDAATPHSNYDISPDDNSFLMISRGRADEIVVIQNFPALVGRLRDAVGPPK